LQNGTGNYLVVDAEGNIYRSTSSPLRMNGQQNDSQLSRIQQAIDQLQAEILALKNELKKADR
jgi:hypothetical protein